MPFQHNYINTAGHKPTSGSTATNELVINYGDNTLWSKDNEGNVYKIINNEFDTATYRLASTNSLTNNNHLTEFPSYRFIDPENIAISGIARFAGKPTAGWSIKEFHIGTFSPHLAGRIKFMQTLNCCTSGGDNVASCNVLTSGLVFIRWMGSSAISWVMISGIITLD